MVVREPKSGKVEVRPPATWKGGNPKAVVYAVAALDVGAANPSFAVLAADDWDEVRRW